MKIYYFTFRIYFLFVIFILPGILTANHFNQKFYDQNDTIPFKKGNDREIVKGSNVPDLAFIDLDTIYRSLHQPLEEGKFVILDLFWTGCQPCWNYYKTGNLNLVQNKFGPNGTNEVVIYSVETESYSGVHCLYGPPGQCQTGNYYTYTYGNFVVDANYIIGNEDSFNKAFDIDAYPDYLILYPNKTMEKISSPSVATIQNIINKYKANTTILGQNNVQLFDLKSNLVGNYLCDGELIAPIVSIRNLGKSNISKIQLQVKDENQILLDTIWTGNLISNEVETFHFPLISFNSGQLMTVSALKVNGTNDEQPVNEVVSLNILKPFVLTSQEMKMALNFKIKADRIYWEVTDEENNIIKKGGNQLVGTDGGGKFSFANLVPKDSTAYENNKPSIEKVKITKPGCYTLKVVDGYSLGINQTPDAYFTASNVAPLYNPLFAVYGYFSEKFVKFTIAEGVIDNDNDGFAYELDCNDFDSTINPQAMEICDGIDNNCNGFKDDEDSTAADQLTWYEDLDGDGFGNESVMLRRCYKPENYVSNAEDCDDNDYNMSPNGIEIANNGVDEDCDGSDLILSTDRNLLGNLEIYPNPAKGYINIQLPDVYFNNENLEISIYNTIGLKIYSSTYQFEKNHLISFDLKNYSSGTYFLLCKNNTYFHVNKITLINN